MRHSQEVRLEPESEKIRSRSFIDKNVSSDEFPVSIGLRLSLPSELKAIPLFLCGSPLEAEASYSQAFYESS